MAHYRKPDWPAIGLAVLLTLLLLEGGFRMWAAWGWLWESPRDGRDITDFARLIRISAHPGIGFELRPRLNIKFHHAAFQTNSLGYRGHEFSTKRKDGLRIIGTCDSVMMGWGVGQDETYLAKLEDILQKRFPGRDIKTYNFAVAGYDTVQEYYVLRDRALSFKPDIIILGYVGNDQNPPSLVPPRIRPTSASLALNFFVLQWLRLAGSLPRKAAYDWHAWEGDLGRIPDGFIMAYRSIAGLAKERGIPLVTVLDSRYQSEIMNHRHVSSLGMSLGSEVIDLHRLYRRLPKGLSHAQETSIRDEHNRRYLNHETGHANESWHERTANVIADRLVQRGLLGNKD